MCTPMEILTPRQADILNGVVEAHIETSGPVGSHYIIKKYAIPVSSATIRNEMGALEEMGYLTHPHTSSGRVPTDSGYRYYLDHASFADVMPESLCLQVARELSQNYQEQREIGVFLEKVTSMLSSMTREIGLSLSMAPEPGLDQKIEGLRLSLQGLTHILEKPEFQDINKLRTLLKTLEEKIVLKQWLLKQVQESQVSVSVGREHESQALENCAIVTARYSAGEMGTGVIAILGPKRMPYRRLVPLVSRVAELMEAFFTEHEEFDT